ncbi:MAG: SPOR domain-containing protein [Steroidobacteraceae bacterium]
MDDALKARLIGAAVLVALAVILIPELLSGRKPETSDAATAAAARGTRTVTIDLTGASPGAAPVVTQATAPSAQGASAATTDAATPPVAAAREPTAPPLAAATPQAASPQPRPQADSSPAKPADTAAPQPPPATKAVTTPTPAIPARGGWAVQVGAFGATATAEKLARELQSAGYKAYVSPVARSGKTLYRVRVGPESERSRAESLAVSLKGRGLPATVVAND